MISSVVLICLAHLWSAPEIIRYVNMVGTQPGDIYSFAIICSEIVTKKAVWNISEIALSEEGML
jgi:hypothetical protein